MLANYHTHTSRCKHAVGEDEEYVKAAIAEGVKILGFSDHAPMPFRDGYESYYKMTLDMLDGYCESILGLKEKYKNEIDIRLGLEIEYYEPLWNECIDIYKTRPIEYLILGQHWIGTEYDEGADPSPRVSNDGTRVTKYVNSVIKAMETGLISCVAHPDLVSYVGDINFYNAEMGRLIDKARELSIPLEYNLLGQSEHRRYPDMRFWAEVARRTAPVIIGCDAHSPARVANSAELSEAQATLAAYGIMPLTMLELKGIK